MAKSHKIRIIKKNKQWKIIPDIKNICEISCKSVLNSLLQLKDYNFSINISLSDNNTVQELNYRFLKKNNPTNILSFPCFIFHSKHDIVKTLSKEDDNNIMLGDIIMAFETIKDEAKEQGKTIENHIKHLLVHATLHLFGYDHKNKKDEKEMEKLEIEILQQYLGVTNPYII